MAHEQGNQQVPAGFEWAIVHDPDGEARQLERDRASARRAAEIADIIGDGAWMQVDGQPAGAPSPGNPLAESWPADLGPANVDFARAAQRHPGAGSNVEEALRAHHANTPRHLPPTRPF